MLKMKIYRNLFFILLLIQLSQVFAAPGGTKKPEQAKQSTKPAEPVQPSQPAQPTQPQPGQPGSSSKRNNNSISFQNIFGSISTRILDAVKKISPNAVTTVARALKVRITQVHGSVPNTMNQALRALQLRVAGAFSRSTSTSAKEAPPTEPATSSAIEEVIPPLPPRPAPKKGPLSPLYFENTSKGEIAVYDAKEFFSKESPIDVASSKPAPVPSSPAAAPTKAATAKKLTAPAKPAQTASTKKPTSAVAEDKSTDIPVYDENEFNKWNKHLHNYVSKWFVGDDYKHVILRENLLKLDKKLSKRSKAFFCFECRTKFEKIAGKMPSGSNINEEILKNNIAYQSIDLTLEADYDVFTYSIDSPELVETLRSYIINKIAILEAVHIREDELKLDGNLFYPNVLEEVLRKLKGKTPESCELPPFHSSA